jgi:hypothetical protein
MTPTPFSPLSKVRPCQLEFSTELGHLSGHHDQFRKSKHPRQLNQSVQWTLLLKKGKGRRPHTPTVELLTVYLWAASLPSYWDTSVTDHIPEDWNPGGGGEIISDDYQNLAVPSPVYNMNSEVGDRAWVQILPPHFLTIWPWASNVTSLCLSSLTYQIKIRPLNEVKTFRVHRMDPTYSNDPQVRVATFYL